MEPQHRDPFIIHQIKSFGFAIEGTVYSFKKGFHFKFHIISALMVTALGIYFSISPTEWAILALTISGVISAETMNTAVEEACDILHPEHHPGARLAKHCAAGAVLILSTAAIFIGLIIFLPKV